MKIISKPLSNLLQRGSNNFDLIRLMAALAVMLTHSYGLQHARDHVGPIRYFIGFDVPGSLAVYAFFLTSGILITQSFDRQNNPVNFGILRFARIWPGLCVNVLVTAFLIGPFFTSDHSLREYFFAVGTLKYVTINAFQFGKIDSLIPSLFSNSWQPGGVNFALWTLPVEMQCYLMVFLFGCLGLFRRTWFLLVSLTLTLIVFLLIATQIHFSPNTFFFFFRPADYSFYPVPYFMLGIACYVLRKKILLNGYFAVLLMAAFVALRHTPVALPLFHITYAYGVLVIAGMEPLKFLRPRNDYSYGIYIYGFVCQQMVANTWPKMDSYLSLLISVPLAILFAAVSWHVVEKPALKFARKFSENWRLRNAPIKLKSTENVASQSQW